MVEPWLIVVDVQDSKVDPQGKVGWIGRTLVCNDVKRVIALCLAVKGGHGDDVDGRGSPPLVNDADIEHLRFRLDQFDESRPVFPLIVINRLQREDRVKTGTLVLCK